MDAATTSQSPDEDSLSSDGSEPSAAKLRQLAMSQSPDEDSLSSDSAGGLAHQPSVGLGSQSPDEDSLSSDAIAEAAQIVAAVAAVSIP